MVKFADNNSDSGATTLSPFFMNHRFHRQMSFGPDPTLYEATRQYLQAQSAGELTANMDEILMFAKKHILEAQEVMSKQANKYQNDIDYGIGDMVFLNSKNIKTQRPSKKLDDKMLGPFKIDTKVGRAFWLELSRTMLIHNMFYPSLL